MQPNNVVVFCDMILKQTFFLHWLEWNHVCNDMYGESFCMYAMVCMDMVLCMNMDYFLWSKRNMDYNKLHWHRKYW